MDRRAPRHRGGFPRRVPRLERAASARERDHRRQRHRPDRRGRHRLVRRPAPRGAAVKRLVLLGGGHAHIEVLRSLALAPLTGVEVTLVTPHARLLYTGMVPGVIAGHYALADAAVDLAALSKAAGAALVLTTASVVSPSRRQVTCSDASVLAYDVLSLDVGSSPVTGKAAGVAKHAVVMRPLEGLVRGWADVRQRAIAGHVKSLTIVGAGAAGVE